MLPFAGDAPTVCEGAKPIEEWQRLDAEKAWPDRELTDARRVRRPAIMNAEEEVIR